MKTQTAALPSRLPIGVIKRSPTNPRKRFPEAEHRELTASVEKHDVLQPLLVRPWPNVPGDYELVAGERRHRAAEAAGKADVPVLIKDLTDDEVLHIQIIENLQRKDVHPLEEADGYKALVDRGHTVEQIANEVSQTRTYVAQRLKLTALIEPARKLFFDGKLNAGTALIVARLPEDLQQKAAKEITAEDWTGTAMSAKRASEHVQKIYMLRLDQAPFKPSDAELVPAAGACGPCPKRTGNQTDLFDDVKSKEICTDPGCFEKKRAAAVALKRAEAEATGRTVIAGKEAKQVKPNQYGQMTGGWVNLDDHCSDDPKYRTYRQIIGAKAVKEAALFEDPHNNKLVDVMQRSDLKKVLADKGVQARSTSSSNGGEAAANAKKKAADAYRGELFRQVRAKQGIKGLSDFEMKMVALTFYRRLWSENQKRITKLYEWGVKGLTEAEFAKKLDEIERNDPEVLAQLVMDIALIDESVSATYSSRGPDLLEATARVRGIDPAAIKKQLDAAAKEKAKPKPKAAPAKKAQVKIPAEKIPAVKKVPVAKPVAPAPVKGVPAKKVAAKKVPRKSAAKPKTSPARLELSPAAAWPFPTTVGP